MSNTSNSKGAFARRLKQPGLISAPGVFEMISARIADTMGFDALYMTGYGVVASHLGLPDAGLASYTEMVGRVHQIASGTSTPLIADGDTGYGGLLNVDHTVRGYEKAGAQAIQIEDQEYPKKCGHTPGRRVVPIEDAARRIKVACEARSSKDFLVIARTDARTVARPRRGAAPRRSVPEGRRRSAVHRIAGERGGMAKIGQTFAGVPLVANMVEGGRTPILLRAELEASASSSRFSPPPDFWPRAPRFAPSMARSDPTAPARRGAENSTRSTTSHA